MHDHHVQLLAALNDEGSLEAAARHCSVTPGFFRAEMAILEAEYRQPMLSTEFDDAQITPAGSKLLGWMHDFQRQCETLRLEIRNDRHTAAVAPLVLRRSISPKRLKLPAPAPDEVELMICSAMCAPDHGAVRPWRIIGFEESQRFALAQLFDAEKRRRDPLASGADLLRAKDHATRSPMLLAFVVSPQMRHKVPVREQWLAAGAALGNFMNAAHQLGYGAIILSGERCFDEDLTAALGIDKHEFLAGFLSLGTISQAPPARQEADPASVFSLWRSRSIEQA